MEKFVSRFIWRGKIFLFLNIKNIEVPYFFFINCVFLLTTAKLSKKRYLYQVLMYIVHVYSDVLHAIFPCMTVLRCVFNVSTMHADHVISLLQSLVWKRKKLNFDQKFQILTNRNSCMLTHKRKILFPQRKVCI